MESKGASDVKLRHRMATGNMRAGNADRRQEMEPETERGLGGDSWWKGVTVWKVTHGFGSSDGGGEQVDYFKTVNSRTPPTGAGIEECLNSDALTVMNIESVEFFWTDQPDDPVSEKAPPDDSAHKRIFDLTSDISRAGKRLSLN
jgi:hypothetical protein